MDPSARGTQPMYSGRAARRGSTGSGSAHRGEDGSHSGIANGYQTNLRAGNGDSHYNDLMKTIYVSNITASMPDDALWEAFGQFGRVESLVRRDVNVDMNNNTEQQYAFIRYRSRQDARYAITTGEVNFYGRKLVIRPRDKPAYMKHNVHGNVPDRARDFEGYEKARSRSFQGTERRFESRGSLGDLSMGYPMSPGHMQSPSVVAPAELLSKILTVANLPADMSPKELYELFAGYGSVERSYIYQSADALGRRFGEVTMASFFFAQKAFEALNCFAIRGVPLDVSYKASPHPIAPVSPDALGVARNYTWAITPQMQWPYHIYSGNGPIPNAHPGAQYGQHNPGIVVPYAVWNTPNNTHAGHANYGYPGIPIQSLPSPTHIPVCVYPPQPVNGGHFRGTHLSNSYAPKNDHGNLGLEAMDMLTIPESGSRSVSGASSTTLVANTEIGLDKKYQSPVIVTSPTYSEHSVDLKAAAVPANHKTPENVLPEKQIQTSPAEHLNQLEQSATSSPQQYDALPESVGLSSTTIGFDPTKPAFVPETSKPRDPSNLYIKNLDDGFITTTMDLKLAFGQFGQIASAFLATYPNGTSKGFGFVAFVNPSDAVSAKEHLDGVILGRKRVFVTFAERKEERTQRLKELFESKKDNDPKDTLHQPKPSTEERSCDSAGSLDTVKSTTAALKEASFLAPEPTEFEAGSWESIEASGSTQTEGEVTMTTTVTTTKAWKGTPLQGIVEVEEEESPCTKKFRQQRTQNFVQQAQLGGLAYKEPQSMSFANTPTSPSSTKSVPDYHSVTPVGIQREACTGSPLPAQQRPRQTGPQYQRRSQSPRNNPRPFYPPGHSDSGSPKPVLRQAFSPTAIPGAPTGPRAQFNNKNNVSSGRENNLKKKKTGRRQNDTMGLPVSDQPNSEKKIHVGKRISANISRNIKSEPHVHSPDTIGAAEHLEYLEIRSAP